MNFLVSEPSKFRHNNVFYYVSSALVKRQKSEDNNVAINVWYKTEIIIFLNSLTHIQNLGLTLLPGFIQFHGLILSHGLRVLHVNLFIPIILSKFCDKIY